MAALICILLNFPKGASLASSGFLINTFHRYKICKKLYGDSKTTFTDSTAGLY